MLCSPPCRRVLFSFHNFCVVCIFFPMDCLFISLSQAVASLTYLYLSFIEFYFIYHLRRANSSLGPYYLSIYLQIVGETVRERERDSPCLMVKYHPNKQTKQKSNPKKLVTTCKLVNLGMIYDHRGLLTFDHCLIA